MSRKKTQKQSSGVIHGTSSSLSPGNSIAKILESPGGLVLVRAGAGTGKTRLLIEYYLAVLDKLLREHFNIKDALQSVLAVTFTNRAADEMLERVTKTLQQRGVSDAEHVASFAEVSTIDAFCAKCLRKYAPFIGLNPDFQIIDGIGARLLFDSVFERLCKENSLPRIDSTYALSTFRNSSWNTICALKSRLILAKDVANLLGNTTHAGFLGTVYAEYNWWGQAPPDESQFQGSGMVDYDPWLTYDPNKIVPMLAASDPGILKADAFHLLEVKGKLQEAMEGYRKVIEDYPNSLAGRVSLSRLVRSYSKLGREWEVIPYLEGLAERHKDDELGGMASHLAAVCLLTVKL